MADAVPSTPLFRLPRRPTDGALARGASPAGAEAARHDRPPPAVICRGSFPAGMSLRAIPLDLSLLRQALSIEHEFGTASLLELGRVALFLERAFYAEGSLVRTPTGIAFTLVNPPLRIGAFRGARLLLDGAEVAPTGCRVRVEGAPTALPFSAIDREHPLLLSPGKALHLEADLPPPAPGRHVVRLELRSSAIPPLVWIEVHDEIRPGPPT